MMATPYCLQLFFGQPKIGIVFSQDDSGSDGRVIKIHLMNIPVNNRLLKVLRVSRLPIQDLFLSIRVVDTLTEQATAELFMPEIELSPSSKDGRVSLPSSLLTATVKLAKWQRSTNSAVLLGRDKLIHLQEGTYKIIVECESDGNSKMLKPVVLYVGKTETELIWDKDIKSKILV